MLKNVSKYELIIDGKLCQIFLESDIQIAQAKEFSFQFLKYLGQIEDNIRAQKETEEQKVEPLPSQKAE